MYRCISHQIILPQSLSTDTYLSPQSALPLLHWCVREALILPGAVVGLCWCFLQINLHLFSSRTWSYHALLHALSSVFPSMLSTVHLSVVLVAARKPVLTHEGVIEKTGVNSWRGHGAINTARWGLYDVLMIVRIWGCWVSWCKPNLENRCKLMGS